MNIIKEWLHGGGIGGRFYEVEGRYFLDFRGCHETCEVFVLPNGDFSFNYSVELIPKQYVKWITNWNTERMFNHK